MTSNTKIKTVTIKGILYELIKIDGVWRYKTERCKHCDERLPYNKTNKHHGVPKFLIGHDKIGKHASLGLRKKLIDAHLKSPNKWVGRRHSNTNKSKERASESMKEFHRLGYQGKDEYSLWTYINNCKKQSEKQDLGFNPLNAPFTGSILHHINDTDVMFIPIEIHRLHGHYLANTKMMKKINNIAKQFEDKKGANKIKSILRRLSNV